VYMVEGPFWTAFSCRQGCIVEVLLDPIGRDRKFESEKRPFLCTARILGESHIWYWARQQGRKVWLGG